MKKHIRYIVTAAVILVAAVPAIASASTTPTLNQTVNNGTLSTDIYQSDDATPVASPTVSFSAINRSFTCQTATATLGDTNDKVNVTNLDATNTTGWTLSIAPTAGAGATWSNGTNTYAVDDSTGSGCTNGQMTIDPSVATLTTDCQSTCGGVTVTKGSSTALDSTVSDSATLMSTTSGTAWEGYLTGISLSQKIPASQPSGSYSIGMTMTVVAN